MIGDLRHCQILKTAGVYSSKGLLIHRHIKAKSVITTSVLDAQTQCRDFRVIHINTGRIGTPLAVDTQLLQGVYNGF